MQVVLLSTYEMGRQPFGLASPAAWLRREGAGVLCQDLSVERLDERAIRSADLVAFHLPMHTATRLAVRALERVKALNPAAAICCYGLYAAMNEPYLRGLGADAILGGEFEAGLASLARRLMRCPPGGTRRDAQREPVVSRARQRFLVPERGGLPPLARYARLDLGAGRSRTVGYTEASRGCKHRCRHCPVVQVYDGRFRVVDRDVVLEDVRQQVAAGAQHISFGDPDFFNGIDHALALVRALQRRHPGLTYDVTIKIEHLLRYAEHLETLRRTGCLLITSAVESIDDRVLAILDKGHTRQDVLRALRVCRRAGIDVNPTFVAFTPWTTIAGYRELLSFLAEQDLLHRVAPIQLTLRLLIPAGSRLLQVPQVRKLAGPFDEMALAHPWRHADPRVDRLQAKVEEAVREGVARGEVPRAIISRILQLAGLVGRLSRVRARTEAPHMTEPWYC